MRGKSMSLQQVVENAYKTLAASRFPIGNQSSAQHAYQPKKD